MPIQLSHKPPHAESEGRGVFYLRLAAFLLHFLAAIFIGYTALKCGSSFVTDTYTELLGPGGYPTLTPAPCHEDCFYGIPQTYHSAQKGLEWNVFALLAAFEWISAGFALWHLDPVGPWRAVAYLWNLVGVLLLAPYATHLSVLQYGITGLSLLAATAVQMYPFSVEPGHVAMHFTEYCTSASLLFLSVLILFVPEPPSWACVVGFVCVLLCNLTGVCAHLSLLEQPEPKPGPRHAWDSDWARLENHFTLFLIYAWLALLVALGCIVYIARRSLTDPVVPLWVRFLLYNLLVTYSLFGLWATGCYVAGALTKGVRWTGGVLGSGLTVLSIAAKLPVVFTVFYGLLRQPSQPLCSL